MVKYCAECGKANEDYVTFCEYCGHKFSDEINKEKMVENPEKTIENQPTINIESENPESSQDNQAEQVKRNQEAEGKTEKFEPVFKEKNPIIAMLLSAIIMGSGYIYLGYYRPFIGIFALGILLLLLSMEVGALLIILLIFYIIQIFGVYTSTKYYNEHNGKLTLGKK